MVIEQWLEPQARVTNTYPFEVTDVKETRSVPSVSDLVELMREAYWGNDYLASVAARYGQEEVRQVFLTDRTSTRAPVRRGDFGEVVTTEFLKGVEGYHIPVVKLRYKIRANQTLPGTDCIALKFDGEELIEVAFVESKFRSSRDSNVGVEGATQLKQDSESETPEILPFIARILRDRDDPVTEQVENYMFGRAVGIENYILAIIHERTLWSENVLVNLKDAEVALEPLHVYIVRIVELRDLADATFSELDLEVIADDQQ